LIFGSGKLIILYNKFRKGAVNAGQSWRCNVPARPGDVVTLKARALDKFIKCERLFVVHDNVFSHGKGDVICSGRGWPIRPM